jgi:outer membrane protein OmpA-like peptidoglycan-associated protein
MSALKRSLSALALLLAATPCAAQIAGNPYEFSLGGGVFGPDARSRAKTGPAWAASAGWRAQPALHLEANVLFAPAKMDLPGEPKLNHSFAGVDLRLDLLPAESRIVPFALGGMAYGLSHSEALDPGKLARGAPSMGAGVLINVHSERVYVRLQGRDVFFRERNQFEFGNHFAATAGLQYAFKGKERDQDLDKVRDWLDKCPNTPIGCKVDANGCPIDSDGDGVCDGIDKCPNTPRGCKVDKDGCPIDSDGDGVCDGVDTCPDTPAGTLVNAQGCPDDDDKDGVRNGDDKCPNTPQGCKVDASGCPIDSDGDGVCDGLDQCANTPAGLKVDDKGCPIEVIEKETELMDTGMIRLEDIHFDTDKWDVLPADTLRLTEVGAVLKNWPELKIEIGGHTDSRGSAKHNQVLSEKRAGSVKAYLLQRYPDLDGSRFTVKGYGATRPIVPNTSATNMARNRRVEFVVTNREVLRKEVQRRRLLKTGETPAPGITPEPNLTPAPSDTTTKP